MHSKVFLNTSVSDVAASKAFFEKLGFSFNDAFGSEHGICLVLNETTSVMLTSRDFFGKMFPKPVADKSVSEVVFSLSCDSPEEVRRIAETAFANGGKQINEPEDNGFMYSWGFADLDNHLWDLFWMNPDHK
jgi:predicted lactoylglutathione lyase